MIRELPAQIEPKTLAEQDANFSGKIAISKFARLRDLLTNTDGDVSVALQVKRDEDGIIFIRGKVETQLQLACQRCGEPVSCDINVELKIRPVITDKQAASVQKSHDLWVTNREPILVQELVEEELLLSLPMIAKHEIEQCPVDLSQVLS